MTARGSSTMSQPQGGGAWGRGGGIPPTPYLAPTLRFASEMRSSRGRSFRRTSALDAKDATYAVSSATRFSCTGSEPTMRAWRGGVRGVGSVKRGGVWDGWLGGETRGAFTIPPIVLQRSSRQLLPHTPRGATECTGQADVHHVCPHDHTPHLTKADPTPPPATLAFVPYMHTPCWWRSPRQRPAAPVLPHPLACPPGTGGLHW